MLPAPLALEANYHILGYAVRRVGAADAHDLTAETFAIAWRRLYSVPGGDDARLWLYSTARKVIANHRRGERRRRQKRPFSPATRSATPRARRSARRPRSAARSSTQPRRASPLAEARRAEAARSDRHTSARS